MKQKLKEMDTKIKESKVLRKTIGTVLVLPGALIGIALLALAGFGLVSALLKAGMVSIIVGILVIGMGLGFMLVTFYGADLLDYKPKNKKETAETNTKPKGESNKDG